MVGKNFDGPKQVEIWWNRWGSLYRGRSTGVGGGW